MWYLWCWKSIVYCSSYVTYIVVVSVNSTSVVIGRLRREASSALQFRTRQTIWRRHRYKRRKTRSRLRLWTWQARPALQLRTGQASEELQLRSRQAFEQIQLRTWQATAGPASVQLRTRQAIGGPRGWWKRWYYRRVNDVVCSCTFVNRENRSVCYFF